MSTIFGTNQTFPIIVLALLTLAGLTGCAAGHSVFARHPEASASDKIRNREGEIARRFCDKAVVGKTMADEEYADCYYYVLQKRIRASR